MSNNQESEAYDNDADYPTEKAQEVINRRGIDNLYVGQADSKHMAAIAHMLQSWLDRNAYRGAIPMVTVHLSRFEAAIHIDDFPVWSSELDTDDELSFEFCLERYKDDIYNKAVLCGLITPAAEDNEDDNSQDPH